MITYELAKQLKDAGFLATFKDTHYVYLSNGIAILFDRVKGGLRPNGELICYSTDLIYIPMLSELIEACGDKIESLFKVSKNDRSGKSNNDIKGGWEAMSLDSGRVWEWGLTPEEAAALLWLELNKNAKPAV